MIKKGLLRKIFVATTLGMCMILFYSVHGQIKAPSASYVDVTNYVEHPYQDTVFVFNKTGKNSPDNIGSLEINAPNGEDNWLFQWFRYDPVNRYFDFLNPLKSENNVNSSSLQGLNSGGYAVMFSNGIQMDTAVAWIFVNNFINRTVEIQNKDNEGKLTEAGYICAYVELKANVETDTFYYYDLTNDSMLVLSNYVSYAWSSDPEGKNPNNSEEVFRLPVIRDRTYEPPTEDTHYFLEVTDKYGAKKTDTIFYETIQTKAVLDTIASPVTFNDGGQYYNTQKKDTRSAPFQVFFSPKESENAFKYIWNFGDENGDTTYYTADSVEYIFYDPLKSPYTISLTTVSEEGCESKDSVEIEIEESTLAVPPYFTPKVDQPGVNAPEFVTPNGDGSNDYFRVYDVSIREFEIIIFNRWGRIVNQSKGSDIRDWKGWDGYMGNSRRPAPEGVYYYVLKAKGWDGVDYEYPDKNQEIKGFFHLFRENRR